MAEEAQIRHMSCDFCGKARSEVEKLIVANDAAICNECIDLCYNLLDQEKLDKIKADKKITKMLDPVKIKRYMDQHVVGQERAKIALCVSIVNHYKRAFFNPKIEVEKSNLLMYGPSGSGKTLLAKFAARYLNVPFVIADATSLTQAGYVGEDVESLISRLLIEANNDVGKCQQGIVFIDEIDKIARKSESASLQRDVGGEGVQQALLKLVEGTTVRISVSGNVKKTTGADTVEIDTRNILFIAGGAFEGLDKILQQRQQGYSIGFVNKQDNVSEVPWALPEDFMKYGMIPEFIGRFPVSVGLNSLSLEDLTRVLIEPRSSLLEQMSFYFTSDGITLDFEDAAILAIAQQALDLNIGARGLKTILERLMTPLMYGITEMKKNGVKHLTISESMITNIDNTTTEKHESKNSNRTQSRSNQRSS